MDEIKQVVWRLYLAVTLLGPPALGLRLHVSLFVRIVFMLFGIQMFFGALPWRNSTAEHLSDLD